MIWHWNDTVLPVMYLNDNQTLAVMLSRLTTIIPSVMGLLISERDPQTMGIMMAGCVLFVVPMLIIYLIVQRWFIESIDRVGITG